MAGYIIIKIFREIIAVLLYIPIVIGIILLIIISSPTLLFRKCVGKYAQLFKTKDLGKRVSARSTIMTLGSIYENPKNVIVIPMFMKGRPKVEELRNQVEKHLINARNDKNELKYPELKQNLVVWKGFLFWRHVKGFKIEDHIYIPSDMDKEGWDPIIYSKQLLNKNWSEDKGLWEMIIVPNVKPSSKLRQQQLSLQEEHSNDSFVIYLRLHHSLADGFSALKFLQEIDYSGNMKRFLDKASVFDKPSNNILRDLGIALKVPYDVAKSLTLFKKTSYQPFDEVLNQGMILKLTGKCSRGLIDLIPLKELKELKNSIGIGLTPLLSTMIVGGLRKFFMEKLSGSNKKLPCGVTMRFPVLMLGHSEKFRNKMAFATILVNFDENDPIKRAKEIQEEFDKVKKSTISLTMSWLTVLGGCLPYSWLMPMINKTFKEQLIFLSNFPAPVEGFNILDSKMLDGFFAPTVSNTGGGMLFNFSTCNTELTFTVGADEAILQSDDEANKLLELCLEEIKILKTFKNFNEISI